MNLIYKLFSWVMVGIAYLILPHVKEQQPKNNDYVYLDEEKRVYHPCRCSDVPSNFTRLLHDDFKEESLWRGEYSYCEKCLKIVDKQFRDVLAATLMIFAMIPFIKILESVSKRDIRFHKIWITSPDGNNYQLPQYQALRILRKQKGWTFTEVIPKPSRAQALIIALKGTK